jgi:hypothetical protein
VCCACAHARATVRCALAAASSDTRHTTTHIPFSHGSVTMSKTSTSIQDPPLGLAVYLVSTHLPAPCSLALARLACKLPAFIYSAHTATATPRTPKHAPKYPESRGKHRGPLAPLLLALSPSGSPPGLCIRYFAWFTVAHRIYLCRDRRVSESSPLGCCACTLQAISPSFAALFLSLFLALFSQKNVAFSQGTTKTETKPHLRSRAHLVASLLSMTLALSGKKSLKPSRRWT